MNKQRLLAWLLLVVGLASPGRAHGGLITNGNFESGLTGWTVANQLSSTDYAGGHDALGSFYLQGKSGTLPVSGGLTGNASLLPYSGNDYAISDSTAPGAHALIQSFTVPTGATSVTLSFAMYTYDWYGNGATGNNLNYTSVPNQHVQVDILSANASAFAEGTAVVENLYNGEQPDTSSPAWVYYTYNLTGVALAGGTYQLRFAEVDNQFTLNMGVDDVSIAAVVPEPSSLLMLSIGGVAVLLRIRRSPNSCLKTSCK